MACGHEERELIGDKPQPDKDRAGFPSFLADLGIGEQDLF